MKNKTNESARDRKMDKEANYFARCLLMPEQFIKKAIHKIKDETSEEELVKMLAKKFKVTEYQMTVRLIELKIVLV